MSDVTNAVEPDDAPEEPTNRPPSIHRAKEWITRPYARRIMILTIVVSLIMMPLAWLIVAAMNQSGGPSSDIMAAIEQTVFVFTIVSIPITAFVFAVLLYSLFGWKQVSGDEPPMQESPSIRTNTVAVITWITVSSLLAAFLVVWGLIELAAITMSANGSVSANQQPNSQQALIVNVTGQQWLWTFEYPQYDGLTSDILYLPEGRPVYFNVTSKDVMHSFWAVELGVKIDANPGAITQTGMTATKLGTFNVRCAELCGLHHAYMETEIKVVTPDQFNSWSKEMGGAHTS